MKLMFICLFISYVMIAQNAAIQGYVYDENGNPLTEKTIRLDENNYVTKTDQSGYFEFLNIKSNSYMIIVDELESEIFIHANQSHEIQLDIENNQLLITILPLQAKNVFRHIVDYEDLKKIPRIYPAELAGLCTG